MNNLWVHTEFRVDGVRYDRARGFRVFESAVDCEQRSSYFHRYIVPLFFFSTLLVVPFIILLFVLNIGNTAQVTHSFVELNFPGLSRVIYGSGSGKEILLSRLTQIERREAAGQAQFIADIISQTKAAPQAAKLARVIVSESIDAGIDPLLVASVIQTESLFQSRAASHKGASGLMQLMPETGKFTARLAGAAWMGSWRLNDPAYNVQLGIAYLKYLREMFNGDIRKALVAYNWGPANLAAALKAHRPAPLSTRQYAGTILARYRVWNSQVAERRAAFKYLDTAKILG